MTEFLDCKTEFWTPSSSTCQREEGNSEMWEDVVCSCYQSLLKRNLLQVMPFDISYQPHHSPSFFPFLWHSYLFITLPMTKKERDTIFPKYNPPHPPTQQYTKIYIKIHAYTPILPKPNIYIYTSYSYTHFHILTNIYIQDIHNS